MNRCQQSHHAVLMSGLAALGLLLGQAAKGQEYSEEQAGLFVEPMVTYSLSSTSVNYPSPLSNSEGSANGFGIGGRVGVHFAGVFFAGLDGRYSKLTFKEDSTNYDAPADAMNWGPVVGMQTPVVGLRVWGAFIAGANMNPERSGALDVKLNDGMGYRFGVGFRLLPVSANLEYQAINYSTTSLEALGPFSASTDFGSVELDDKSWIFSVSFPLSL